MRLAVICPGLHHLARSPLAAAADDLDPPGCTSVPGAKWVSGSHKIFG
jgi:hypothetical protein